MRDVCSSALLAQPILLGGPGHIVAIDESVVARRKPGNAQGRPVPAQWVFGGVDLGTGEFFMQLVPRRDEATLLPIINRYILPGTRIWSDEWAAYRRLNQHGFLHETVNHTQHYVNPATGVHTNNIEARWAACKGTFKRRNGVTRSQIPSYIDEYMWRSKHPAPNTFNDIVAAIRARYPV